MEFGAGTWGGTNKGSSCRRDVLAVWRNMRMVPSNTYRAFELSPLSPTTLEDVVQADFRACKLLTSSLARTCHRACPAIATTIAVDGIAVEILIVSVSACLTTFDAWSSMAFMCRFTSSTLCSRRCTSFASNSRRRSRVWLPIVKNLCGVRWKHTRRLFNLMANPISADGGCRIVAGRSV